MSQCRTITPLTSSRQLSDPYRNMCISLLIAAIEEADTEWVYGDSDGIPADLCCVMAGFDIDLYRDEFPKAVKRYVRSLGSAHKRRREFLKEAMPKIKDARDEWVANGCR